jgi:hypothetical protein
MKIWLSILLFISSLDVIGSIPQKKICIVKVYAMRFTDESRIKVKVTDVKSLSTLIKRIKDKESLRKICEGLNQLIEVTNSSGDTRMMFIVRYSLFKKEIFYTFTNKQFQFKDKIYINEKLFSDLINTLPKDYQP